MPRPHRWLPGFTATPGRLWRVLHLADGNVVPYEDIIRRVWGDHIDEYCGIRRVYVTVYELRCAGIPVVTVNGVGLKLGSPGT